MTQDTPKFGAVRVTLGPYTESEGRLVTISGYMSAQPDREGAGQERSQGARVRR
jgi:hypothetical protein